MEAMHRGQVQYLLPPLPPPPPPPTPFSLESSSRAAHFCSKDLEARLRGYKGRKRSKQSCGTVVLDFDRRNRRDDEDGSLGRSIVSESCQQHPWQEKMGYGLYSPGIPRLLFMGLRRSGKSSITNVVFQKLPPSETLYLESTHQIAKNTIESCFKFEIWDFPAHLNPNVMAEFDTAVSQLSALVWVIDAQDDYSLALDRLVATILHLSELYGLMSPPPMASSGRLPGSQIRSTPQTSHEEPYIPLHFEIFVHKIDGLSPDFRQDVIADIQQRLSDDLADAGLDDAVAAQLPLHFHLTSIYDCSIYEALSRVVQNLLAPLPALENLVNALVSKCGIHKAYLFDVASKIYVASDAGPPDAKAYQTCADYLDLVVDLSNLFGYEEDRSNRELLAAETGAEDAEATMTMEKYGVPSLFLREVHSHLLLVCTINEGSVTHKKALLDYNLIHFRDALGRVLAYRGESVTHEGLSSAGGNSAPSTLVAERVTDIQVG